MAYKLDKQSDEIVIDGFEKGIAASPELGIANIQNFNTTYYPSVAYVNYRRRASTINGGLFFAGAHSTNVSNNMGWIFNGSNVAIMTNPVQKATSPAGLHYILDDSGQIFKQTAVNSTTFTLLQSGLGRYTMGAKGLAYWQDYLLVFGNGIVEFCGDGTGDSTIVSTNWNLSSSGIAHNTGVFTTNFAVNPTYLTMSTSPNTPLGLPRFAVNDPVQFTTTGTLPTGLSLLTTYYILTIDTANQFITVSTSVGGSAVTLSSDGTGTHTVTDYATPLPLGNCTSFSATGFTLGSSTLTITSYVSPTGLTVNSTWQEPTGLYNITMTDGGILPANFTYGSATINLLSPIIYIGFGSGWTITLLDTTVSNYRPYVSKVDGSLYFCNGQYLGRIARSTSPNINVNAGLASTYVVSFGVASLPEEGLDTIVDMVDLKSSLVLAGNRDVYTWDYVSAQASSPAPVGEQISSITNLLNNIYILAGQKGNIYVSNGYSAQLMYKLPDFIAGVIDPVWSWGGLMVHRSRLFFQALAQNTSGTNLLAGIFSLMVSPSMIGEEASGLVMEAQNSYGLTPASGALKNGLLIDNNPSANGNDSYYSAWSNGATTGGIDYNDTSLWQNYEPTIETDIIPVGTILDKKTFGRLHFKLDRPMVTGDSIKIYWRASLSDSYTLLGTTSTAQLSEDFPSTFNQLQWLQFKIQMKCASSGSSFIPLREIRIQTK